MDSWYMYLLWGGLGSLAVEILDFQSIARAHKEFPWRVPGEARWTVHLCVILTRVLLGAVVAVGLGVAGLTTEFGGFVTGIAAPRLVEHYRFGRRNQTQLDSGQDSSPDASEPDSEAGTFDQTETQNDPRVAPTEGDEDYDDETRVNNA